jgi:hypothetical protein
MQATPNSRSRLRLATEDLAPLRWAKRQRDALLLRSWEQCGRPIPPPHAFKRALVKRIAHHCPARVFVETGTFYGDMVKAIGNDFNEIISIELSARLHQIACRRFRGRDHMTLLHGDSSTLLPQVLARIKESCVFWLDAHHSGAGTATGSKQTPILEELYAILTHTVSEHVILIDDARCFNGTEDYPSLDDLQNLVLGHGDRYEVTVSSDVVQIWPKAWANEMTNLIWGPWRKE